MKEIWVSIIGYEGRYEISNFGNVKSLKRKKVKKDRILKNHVTNGGYLSAKLTSENDKGKLFHVHRLVLINFVGVEEGKTQVNHKDGNKHNNKLNNLEWVTPSENIKHAYDNGLKKGPINKKNRKTKLNKDIVKLIKNDIKLGFMCTDIAKKYNVTPNIIYLIKLNKTWKNV